MFPAPPNFSAAVHPLPGLNFGPPQPFSSSSVSQGQYLPQDPLHQGADPSSPDLFKSNVALVHQQVLELQTFARQVLSAIQHAYQMGNSPAHTEANIATLKQMISLVTETMRQSGVGALPILHGAASGAATVPTEEQLLASTTQNLRTIYETLQHSQDSAATAANLVSADYGPIRAAPQTIQTTMQK